MRPIVCTGAMDAETLWLIHALENAETVTLGCWKCVQGELDGYPVVIVRTNQGMANAAASTALAIERFAPCAVLNQGTSGGHAPDLHTGDIVIGAQVINMGAVRTPERARGAGIDPVCGEPLGLEIANTQPGDGEKKTEEMEAAASAQICAAYGVPFLTVRILSNTAVHGEPFDERTGEACQKFARAVMRNYRVLTD